MPSKVRVYELARELGLTNAETIDLCEQLGIGVKSHSSSIVDAQADRVRRKAEREGLVRDEQPARAGEAGQEEGGEEGHQEGLEEDGEEGHQEGGEEGR